MYEKDNKASPTHMYVHKYKECLWKSTFCPQKGQIYPTVTCIINNIYWVPTKIFEVDAELDWQSFFLHCLQTSATINNYTKTYNFYMKIKKI